MLETLQKVVDEGIDEDAVNAVIHRLEIESKEVSNAQFPFALKFVFDMINFLHFNNRFKFLLFVYFVFALLHFLVHHSDLPSTFLLEDGLEGFQLHLILINDTSLILS